MKHISYVLLIVILVLLAWGTWYWKHNTESCEGNGGAWVQYAGKCFSNTTIIPL